SANLEGVYKVIAAQQPVASVGVVAGYTDASKTTFTVRTNLNFFTAKSGLNYRLSYVLLESGMIAYQQGYNKDTEMNHVARMNYSFDGFSNSVPKSVEEEEDVESFRDLEMPTTVQNKDNVELVCLLIDGISGHIVNAAKCEIDAEAPVSAIRETRQQLVPVFTVSNGQLNLNGYRGTVSVYDASGKQVSADHLKAGLYILRATDGSQSFVQKVVVR
uniref:Omp28-related outer membrane protein n=1 Tax=Prevotella sp. TaxID=59823 RepID=UPI003FF135B7